MTTYKIELRDKFAELEADISATRGDFAFFALFAREDLPDRWDLMISAPWASADEKGAIDYLVARIKADIEPNALVQLSRIIIIMSTTLHSKSVVHRDPGCLLET